ncbi:MAG: UDP-N-acetylmuramoyl-tripeptide--D-alanyl-D-alanine ligase [Treponema sp.]|jgi:UDP-N-acetylmuramoyl-tripeptide--D-alanyl-D-alanine ligase|nr:UDP-N-acetylmuramoyl-tripeptide--D-alanyl-D-alanine ligase [Treponema sp.]
MEKMVPDRTLLMKGADLSSALDAQLISFYEAAQGDPGCSSVSIDSRTVLPGALFVALTGTVQDGHRYVEAAFKAGAVMAMVARSRLEEPSWGLVDVAMTYHGVLLVVKDTLRGLQDAARIYLEKFPRLLRIGITGSSGKTTTKELAAAIIGTEKAVVANPGNLNSETGLPLSVFMVRADHEVGIFELGMNRKGEIGELARILKPHIALITNIGSAHIGILGSKQAIAAEKKAIFSEFSGTETALIPTDEREYRAFLAQGVRGKVLFYGPTIPGASLAGPEILWEGVPVRFGLPGKHNLWNALAAIAIAQEVPVSSAAIRGGLESVSGLFGRSEILHGPVTVVRDCYNANPESTMAAIAMCDDFDWAGRRIYVLGSMLELGEVSQAAHEQIGRYVLSSKADMVCFFGPETQASLGVVESGGVLHISCFHTNSMDALSAFLARFVRPGDLVLLKGSRACALERLTEVLMEHRILAETAGQGGWL